MEAGISCDAHIVTEALCTDKSACHSSISAATYLELEIDKVCEANVD